MSLFCILQSAKLTPGPLAPHPPAITGTRRTPGRERIPARS